MRNYVETISEDESNLCNYIKNYETIWKMNVGCLDYVMNYGWWIRFAGLCQELRDNFRRWMRDAGLWTKSVLGHSSTCSTFCFWFLYNDIFGQKFLEIKFSLSLFFMLQNSFTVVLCFFLSFHAFPANFYCFDILSVVRRQFLYWFFIMLIAYLYPFEFGWHFCFLCLFWAHFLFFWIWMKFLLVVTRQLWGMVGFIFHPRPIPLWIFLV